MKILERLGLARPKIEVAKEIILNPPPQPSVRDALRNWAEGKPEGFIDAAMYPAFPTVTASQLRTRRNELVAAGLIVDTGLTAPNADGKPCRVWLHSLYWPALTQPKPKRPTYSQLRQKLTTAELENSILKSKLAAFEQADNTKAIMA